MRLTQTKTQVVPVFTCLGEVEMALEHFDVRLDSPDMLGSKETLLIESLKNHSLIIQHLHDSLLGFLNIDLCCQRLHLLFHLNERIDNFILHVHTPPTYQNQGGKGTYSVAW